MAIFFMVRVGDPVSVREWFVFNGTKAPLKGRE